MRTQSRPLIHILLLALVLVGAGLVGPVGATVYQDGAVSNHVSNIQPLGKMQLADQRLSVAPIFVREDQQDVSVDNIVTVSENGDISLDYTMDTIPEGGGVVVEVLAQDNIGMWMPVWGGTAYQSEGTWSFNLADAGLPNDGRTYLYRLWRNDDEL
jgi:hypothetical protein